ncbi:MAG: quinolinate synthase NadA [Acidobacteriota bacterium]|nr:quinolinate synthase NadA [Acidobacteriota bacterium]
MNVQVLTDYEKTQIGERQPLPERYLRLSDEEMATRIAAAKAALGDRVVILGHHYQRDEVIQFADYIGDSLKLAQYAATKTTADYIIFCGVHFMAESADILSASHQQVVLPDLAAGCSMADMAAIDQLEMCWNELAQLGASSVVPVTYINSAAAIKAFCGEHGGIVCTSSNAAKVMTWAWSQRVRGADAGDTKVLMLPDQHLGRNTAVAMGVPLDKMVVWDPNEPFGGLTREQVEGAKLILWKGHCSVHTRFTVAQIDLFRKQWGTGLGVQDLSPRVIAHPECTLDVVLASDESGSTEHIIRTVKNSPKGSVWAVATEIHLVNRLAAEVAPDRTVITLDPFGCLCSTMFRVSPNHLLWTLEGLVEGKVYNRIVVDEPQKSFARVALDRMLEMV